MPICRKCQRQAKIKVEETKGKFRDVEILGVGHHAGPMQEMVISEKPRVVEWWCVDCAGS